MIFVAIPPSIPVFEPFILISEMVFCIIAVIFCSLIYFKTKDIYDLTKYQGIRYFRGAFLFFGISYVISFILGLLFFSSATLDYHIPREFIAPFLVVISYISTMAILYLIFSSIWKRFNNKHMLILGHVVAISLAVIAFITRSHIIIFVVQLLLLIVAVLLILFSNKKNDTKHKSLSQMKLLYLLVAVLWILNLFILGRRGPHDFEWSIFLRIASLSVFGYIYYKILKWVK